MEKVNVNNWRERRFNENAKTLKGRKIKVFLCVQHLC